MIIPWGRVGIFLYLGEGWGYSYTLGKGGDILIPWGRVGIFLYLGEGWGYSYTLGKGGDILIPWGRVGIFLYLGEGWGYSYTLGKGGDILIPWGRVGIFYKSSLPLKIRNDLSFHECIVTGLRFRHKMVLFTVLYWNSSLRAGSIEFVNFLHNFDTLVSIVDLKTLNFWFLLVILMPTHSEVWWVDSDTNNQGHKLPNTFFQSRFDPNYIWT